MSDYPVPVGVTKSVKRMFILAFREGLLSNNLRANDPVVRRLDGRVTAEYPVERVEYPSLWVTVSFGRLSWQDLNPYYVNESVEVPYRFKIGEFEATVHVEVLALSNEERDALVDAVVNMVMFGHVEDDSNRFLRFLVEEPFLDVTPMLSEVSLGAESVTFGTPWDESQIAYTRSLSFKVFGEFAQRLDSGVLVPLREVDVRFGGSGFTVGG